jgi:ABC-type lipoprotein release transport system permease subunit
VRQRSSLASILTLTAWRWRQTWWQMLLAGTALLASMLVACVVPLCAALAANASVASLFNASPLRSNLALVTGTQGLSTATLKAIQQRFTPLIRTSLQANLENTPPALVIQLPRLQSIAPHTLPTSASLTLYATSLQRLKPGLRLVAGHWPSEQAGAFEILLTSETAQALHLSIGQEFTLMSTFTTVANNMRSGPADAALALHVRLAGTFEAATQNAPQLYSADFQPAISQNGTTYTLLAEESTLLALADQWAGQHRAQALFATQQFTLSWYYQLRTSGLQQDRLEQFSTQLAQAEQNVGNEPVDLGNNLTLLPAFPYVLSSQLSSVLSQNENLLSLLTQLQNRLALVRIPVMILAAQALLLLFFFACLLLNMLVDRQVASNALLNSRGASPRQVFWSLAMQGLGLCLLACLLGPPLALLAVEKGASALLPASEQGVVVLTLGHTSQVAGALAPYLVGVLIVEIALVCLIFRGAVSGNLLDMRREAARASKQPFWLRYYLDLLAALIAISGFGVSLYLADAARALDASTQDLIIAPLSLIAPLFLLLSFLLLFLRFFPLVLRLFAWGSRPTRGVTGMLALVQMARAPRPATRMIMLLSLAIAFTFFGLVFDASQLQRTVDIATFESGADFRGDLPQTLLHQKLSVVTNTYAHVPGVLAVSVGLTVQGSATGVNDSNVSMELRAVDAQTFANTAIWHTSDSVQPLPTLLALLRAQSGGGIKAGIVPIILDENAASQLNVTVGSSFSTLFESLASMTLRFSVVAVVTRIPTINSALPGSSTPGSAGMLADYPTLKTVYDHLYQHLLGLPNSASGANAGLPLNALWLRTSDDPRALASLRATLSSPVLGLSHLYDRRAIIDELQHDPLFFNILLTLGIGGAAALLLALVADLLASWLSIRTRRSNFVILRALGASTRQVAGLLLWEQAITYLLALSLSIAFGLLLAHLAVPGLVFTGLPAQGGMSELDAGTFYVLQQIVPVEIVIPPTLQFTFLGLVALCMLVLIFMVRAAMRPSMAQELRLNED